MVIRKITKYLGLAPADEVREKFDENIAQVILDERKIVFWRFGMPFGAMFGAFVMWLLILTSQVMRFLYG